MDVFGLLSLLFGILGTLSSYWYVGIVPCAIGLVLGIIGMADSYMDSKPAIMGFLFSILGAIASVFFIVSDLDSGVLVSGKVGGEMIASAENDDFMRFHKEGWTPDQAGTDVAKAENREDNKENQEEEITPYWIKDSEEPEKTIDETEERQEEMSQTVSVQPENVSHEEERKNGGIGNEEYGIGDTWSVDGQFKFTINSVEETSERQKSGDKSPDAVYIINYTYENLGYEGAVLDGLYMDPSAQSIVDSSGEVGYGYYLVGYNEPKQAPVGAHCNAQVSIGVNHKGNFKIYMEEYYSNGNGGFNKETAVFNIIL